MLAAFTSWWIVAVGALCVLAAWFYTGGPRPYGYRGLGEVSVFVFFGLAAVAGTAYVQMERLSWLGLAASVPAGLLSCALLMVNNLRDISSDASSGKRTLAVRIGDARARSVYLVFLLAPFVLAALIGLYRPFALLALLAVPLSVAPVRAVRGGVSGPGLIATLGQTGRLQLAFGLVFTVGPRHSRLTSRRPFFVCGVCSLFGPGGSSRTTPSRNGTVADSAKHIRKN